MANWYCHIVYLLNGFQVIIITWSQLFVSWETWRCRSSVSHTIRLRTILNSDRLTSCPNLVIQYRWQELLEGLVSLSSFWRRLFSHNPVVIVFIRELKHVVVNQFSPHLFPIRCTKAHVVLSLHKWEHFLIPQKQMSVLSTITTMYVHVKVLKPKFVLRVYHLAQSNWILSFHKYYWSVIYNSNK